MIRRLLLASVPQSVPKAVRFVESRALEHQLPQELTDRIMLATSEAVANAIVHGNRYDPLKHVALDWSFEDSRVALSIRDEGRGLQSKRVDDPALPADMMQTSGRGLYIMNMLADQVNAEEGHLHLVFQPRQAGE